MRIVTYYILRYLLLGTVLVTIGLTCVLWLSQSLRFIELMSRNGLSVITFAGLSLLLLPNLVIIILPIALFIVTLFFYHRLILDKELIALQATGVSHLQLSVPPMILATIATIVCFLLTIYVVPTTVRQFKEIQWTARNHISSALLQEGVFTEVVKDLTVYIRSRTRDGDLVGLLIHDKRTKDQKIVTLMAERGTLIPSELGLNIFMVNGNRQEISPDDHRLSILYFDSYALAINISLSKESTVRSRDARERSVIDLLTISSSEEAGLSQEDIHRFRSEAHQRLVTPLFNLSFVAVVLAILLPQSPFEKKSLILKSSIAITIIIIVEITTLGITSLSSRHVAILALLYVLVLLPLGVSLRILSRA